jgi:putative hydrolase of the HAD superfamily
MDGAAALVSALAARHIVIGVVSNGADKSRVDTVAQLSFRRHIATVLSSERAGMRKPDSRLFAAAATELGFAHNECVFVGDHPLNDIAGALAAGMFAIWLNGFHPWPTDMAEAVPVASSLVEVGRHIAM